MGLLALALSLALPMNGATFTGDWRLGVDPVFCAPAPTERWGASATALPGVILYDPRDAGTAYGIHSNPHLMRHELAHAEQMTALGLGFFVAYALTGGRAFEPYDPLHEWYPALFPSAQQPERVGMGPTAHDMTRTWMPSEEQRGAYPLLRLEREAGAFRIQLLPGYPQLARLTVGP